MEQEEDVKLLHSATQEKPWARLFMPLADYETHFEAEGAFLEYKIYLRKTYGFDLECVWERHGYFTSRGLAVFMRIVHRQGQEIPST